MTTAFDVIIVGAGPAGCATAYELSKRISPSKILVLEASPVLLRGKPCGGHVDSPTIDSIPELRPFIVGRTTRQLNCLNGVQLNPNAEGGVRTHVYFTRWGSSPLTLDYAFPKVLSDRGIIVSTGKRVTKIDVGGKHYATVSCGKETFLGKIVIDASGATSAFNRMLCGGKTISELEKYVCSVVEFKVRDADHINLMRFLGNDLLAERADVRSGDPIGAHWVFYYERLGTVNIGNGYCFHGKQTLDTRERLAGYLDQIGLDGWERSAIRTWVIPIELQKHLYTDHTLWIGDSAGMGDPLSGHGIPNSIHVAKILARVCEKALDVNDFSERTLSAYSEDEEMRSYILQSRKALQYVRLARVFGTHVPARFVRFVWPLIDNRRIRRLVVQR